jgi:bifunctional DNA-binding transcriptional regulator/antitoxin component of YhaV-PrlF toxin-antitoxin module
MRAQLGLRPGDRVRIALEDDSIVVKRVSATLADGYRSIPSLGRPLTDEEITEIAAEAAVRDFFKESESD